MGSKIEWTDENWSPVTGCSKISPGCLNCYGERLSRRNTRRKWLPWTVANMMKNVVVDPYKLYVPFRWYEPRLVFVCHMGDLFHEAIAEEFVDDVFGIMGAAWWHTFQVLTKRPDRMRDHLLRRKHEIIRRAIFWNKVLHEGAFRAKTYARLGLPGWPLPNVWPGTSIEDQERADERTPYLLGTPAALRFISAEPLLGSLDIRPYIEQRWQKRDPLEDEVDLTRPLRRLDWVIAGGESGPRARPFDLDWARDLRDQCREAGIPFFMKQMGTHWARNNCARGTHYNYKGGNPEEWPEDLRIREMPGKKRGNIVYSKPEDDRKSLPRRRM